MPVLILLLLGTAIEITVLVLIGNVIGLLPTLALVVLATVLGVVLLRREGMKAVTAFQSKIRSGQPPQAEMLDGVLIAVAGVLVVLPGVVSDVLAIALLFPPTRAVIRKSVLKRAEARASQHRQGQIFIVDAQQ
jgi:UPF0716 protein FxsA